MDEIEFLRVYNAACSAVNEMQDADGKRATHMILQLINSLREQIEDMQLTEEC